ncbi:MAG: ElyC/SanA/YdcF family protein [Actinomycetota bacterium]
MAGTDRHRNLIRRRRIGVAAGLLALLWSLTFWSWVVSPSAADPEGYVEASDAVVLFVGGRGERLETALALIDDELASALVIPNGLTPEWPAANEVCRAADPGVEVFCPTPDPDDTRGEARAIAALAEAEGWDFVTYVTSDYHVARAGQRLDACFDGRIQAVSADSDLGAVTWWRRALREWVGNAVVRTVDRGC